MTRGADFDHDGGVTGSDLSDFFTAHGNGDPEADADLSGGITNDDIGVFYAAWEAGIFGPSRGACAYSGVIAGYAGYVRDRFAPNGDLYHVRHRVYDTRMGTWTKRDPLGYQDGLWMYAYVASKSLILLDSLGLCGRSCTGVVAQGGITIDPSQEELFKKLLKEKLKEYETQPTQTPVHSSCVKLTKADILCLQTSESRQASIDCCATNAGYKIEKAWMSFYEWAADCCKSRYDKPVFPLIPQSRKSCLLQALYWLGSRTRAIEDEYLACKLESIRHWPGQTAPETGGDSVIVHPSGLNSGPISCESIPMHPELGWPKGFPKPIPQLPVPFDPNPYWPYP